MIELFIPIKPQGKARPRVTRRGAYTPQKTKDYENLVKYSFLSRYKNFEIIEGPVVASITAYFPLVKSMSKANQKDALSGVLMPTKKPDIDNIAKAILDALNGFAYYDDSQVVELHINKKYSDNEGVYVKICKYGDAYCK